MRERGMTLDETSINTAYSNNVMSPAGCAAWRASQHRQHRGVDMNQMVVHASHLQGPAHSTRGSDLQRHLHFFHLQPIAITPTLDG